MASIPSLEAAMVNALRDLRASAELRFRREGRREAPGSARRMLARLVPVSSRRHIDPCMRFSRTRLTDALHHRHSACPA
jgi:hypothetical protein